MSSPYATLFSSKPLTGAEAKRRHRFLISALHPDKFSDGSYEKRYAELCTKELNRAWSMVRDSRKRRLVNMLLESLTTDWDFSLATKSLLNLLGSNKLDHVVSCEVFEFVLEESYSANLFQSYVSYLLAVKDLDRLWASLCFLHEHSLEQFREAAIGVLVRLILSFRCKEKCQPAFRYAQALAELSVNAGADLNDAGLLSSVTYFLSGDFIKARQLCHAALDHDPTNTTVCRLLLHYLEFEADSDI